MVANETIRVEVAYAAHPDRQCLLTVHIEKGSTLLDAIERSGVLSLFKEIDLAKQKVGIFSKQRLLSDLVHAGDRIEIYRPLCLDPKEARRAKTRKK